MNLSALSLHGSVLALLALLPLPPAVATRIGHRALHDTSDSCHLSISADDAVAGLGGIFDATCALALTPDIDLASNAIDTMFGAASQLDRGCFSRSCRYCQAFETPRSSRFAPCGSSMPSESSEPRRLASDDVRAQCATLAAETTLTSVLFVIEPACNVTEVAMDGCVPLTPCQLCRNEKTKLNEFLISCDVLNGWKLQKQQHQTQQAQEQVAVATTALGADELDFQGETDSANTTSSATSSSSTVGGLLSPAGAVGAIGVMVVVLVGGVFIVKRHRQLRMEEDALGTPRDAGVLVSVQSRTQIATI